MHLLEKDDGLGIDLSDFGEDPKLEHLLCKRRSRAKDIIGDISRDHSLSLSEAIDSIIDTIPFGLSGGGVFIDLEIKDLLFKDYKTSTGNRPFLGSYKDIPVEKVAENLHEYGQIQIGYENPGKVLSDEDLVFVLRAVDIISSLIYDTRTASIDPLTGLFNRVKLDKLIKDQEEIAYHHNFGIGVLVLDINNFKQINDKYGHAIGDKVLAEVGKIILDVVNPDDDCVRYGGDEILIRALMKENMTSLMIKKIQSAIASTDVFKELIDEPLTISYGSSFYEGIGGAEEAFKEADGEMYYHKGLLNEQTGGTK